METMTEEVPIKVKEGNIFLNRMTWMVFYGLIIVNMLFIITIYVLDIHCEARLFTKDKRYVCGLQHYVWYPFETEDSSLRKFLIASTTGFGQAIFLSFYSSSIVSMFGLPYIIKLRIVDLRERIEEIGDRNLQEFVENFVDYYTEIFG